MSQTIATTDVLDRASLFLPSDHTSQAQQYLSNDPHSQQDGLKGGYAPSASNDAKTPIQNRAGQRENLPRIGMLCTKHDLPLIRNTLSLN